MLLVNGPSKGGDHCPPHPAACLSLAWRAMGCQVIAIGPLDSSEAPKSAVCQTCHRHLSLPTAGLGWGKGVVERGFPRATEGQPSSPGTPEGGKQVGKRHNSKDEGDRAGRLTDRLTGRETKYEGGSEVPLYHPSPGPPSRGLRKKHPCPRPPPPLLSDLKLSV